MNISTEEDFSPSGFIQGQRQRAPHQDWKQQLAKNLTVIIHSLLIYTCYHRSGYLVFVFHLVEKQLLLGQDKRHKCYIEWSHMHHRILGNRAGRDPCRLIHPPPPRLLCRCCCWFSQMVFTCKGIHRGYWETPVALWLKNVPASKKTRSCCVTAEIKVRSCSMEVGSFWGSSVGAEGGFGSVIKFQCHLLL